MDRNAWDNGSPKSAWLDALWFVDNHGRFVHHRHSIFCLCTLHKRLNVVMMRCQFTHNAMGNAPNKGTVKCSGSARVLQGNSATIGKPGGFSGPSVGNIPITANGAAIIPSQWGPGMVYRLTSGGWPRSGVRRKSGCPTSRFFEVWVSAQAAILDKDRERPPTR